MQRRVTRVMDGNGHFDDFTALFLWLRGSPKGNFLVRDVGDFVAHSDERDKGFAWSGVERLAAMMDYYVPLNDLQMPRTHAQFVAAAMAAIQSDFPSEVRKLAGTDPAKAQKILRRALDKVFHIEGRPIIPRSLTARERALLQRYTSVIPIRNVFDELQLLQEFSDALSKNGITIRKGWISEKVLPQLAAFTILKMHLAVVKLKDGRRAPMHATAQTTGERPFLSVQADIPVLDFPTPMSVAVFKTRLDPNIWCEPELLRESRWEFPIELNRASGKFQIFS